MRRFTPWFLLLALACNRGPEPSEAPPSEAPAEPTTAPTADPHGGVPPTSPHGGSPHAVGTHAGATGAPSGATTVDPAAPRLAGVRWSTHEPLTWRAPTSPMRNAEYFVPGEAGEALLTVFHFPGMGGSVEDNVARWVGQFRGPDGAAAPSDVQTRNVAGLDVTVIDVRGTFASGMMGGPSEPQANQRLLGAIVSGPSGPVFFKLVGPEATVETAKSAFDDLVASFEAG
jgi:hypothetical protein